ncbi:MAG: hypothetical protein VYA30_08045 [Myxococcota bacterium]|nr:hypothetical protein [Myxococcota bacterium]
MRHLLVLAVVVLQLGCPGSPKQAIPIADGEAECSRHGQRCRTPKGPLGVCLQEHDGNRLWRCIPQH